MAALPASLQGKIAFFKTLLLPVLEEKARNNNGHSVLGTRPAIHWEDPGASSSHGGGPRVRPRTTALLSLLAGAQGVVFIFH